MNGSKKAILKTITWRLIASFTTFMLALLFFRDIYKSGLVAFFEAILKMIFYYFHEIMWENLKIDDNNKSRK